MPRAPGPRSNRPQPRAGLRALPLWLVLACSGPAAAAEPALKNVWIQGSSALPPSRIHAYVADFIGQPADAALLEKVRRAVAEAYDAAGLGLVAIDAPQLYEGVAVVRVQSLTLGRVQVLPADTDGPALPPRAQAEAQAALPALQSGISPNLRDLDRQLRLANLQPHRRWAIDFRSADAPADAPPPEPPAPPATGFSLLPGQTVATAQDPPVAATPPLRPAVETGQAAQGQVDAHVLLSGASPFYGRLLLDNDGQDATGRERARLQLGHGDAFGPGRALDLTLLTSIEHPSAQRQIALRYQHPVPAWASLVTLEASRATSRPGLVQEFFDVSGDSRSLNLGVRHLLARRGALEPYVEVGLERSVHDDVVGFSGINLGSKVGATPLLLSMGATWQGNSWTAFGQARLRHNTGWGGYGHSADYDSARAGATPHWTALDLAAETRHAVGGGAEFVARAQAQWSRDALISPQQFRVGGASMMRGLKEGELGGDKGVALALEFWWSLPAEHRIGVLLDGAAVRRNQVTSGDLARASAASGGLAWQWRPLPALRLQASVARLLRVNHLPQREAGDTRLHAMLDWSF